MDANAAHADASDEDLAARAKAGDEQALGLLFERYETAVHRQAGRRLFGRIRRRLGASDVVQDAWVALLVSLPTFEDRGPGSFRRWFGAIVQHRADDAVKRHVHADKRSARREVSAAGAAERVEPAAPPASPSRAVALEEGRAKLRAALDAVEGDDRVVLHLVHEQGMTFEAAGRILGRSADATRKLYGRAVLRLGRSVRRAEAGRGGGHLD